MKTKEEIRKEILKMRTSHPEPERAIKSAEIERRLFSLDAFAKARTVLFYAAKGDEVLTKGMILRALSEGKRVALPVVRQQDLVLSEIRSFEGDLAPGKFGIPEPKVLLPIGEGEVEAVVVPGVAFDEDGNRIGFGKGYYDRLLKRLGERIPKIGLAYEFQVVPKIPAGEWDIPIHLIVTEKRTIRC